MEGTAHIRMYKFKGLCCVLDWFFHESLFVLGLIPHCANGIIVCISLEWSFLRKCRFVDYYLWK